VSTSARTSAQPAFGLKLPERYRVKRHIATGGMASVWCAEDRVLGRSVAIKVLSDRFAHDEDSVRRFMRESRAAARVSNHPHVVTIYDVGDIEPEGEQPSPRAFIVMEFLAGGTVADALRVEAIRSEETRRWVSEAASALDHAHERGIVHRDIKPANFLLDRGRGLHVADFGIAHLQNEDTITSTGQLFGTAAYLAPEQALGKDATGASDRYALAVATFELLTGGRPFTASHFAAQARQHIEDEPPLASEREPSVPPAVDAVLARGMAKDPEDRYPTARAFTEDLDAALDNQPTAATEALTARTERLPTRRRRGAAALAGGAAAGGALAGAAAANAAQAANARPANARAAGARAATSPPRRSPPASRPTAVAATPPARSGRAVALTALAIVVLGVIALIAQLSGGGSSTPAASRHAGSASAGHTPTKHKAAAKRPAAKRPAAKSSSSSSSSSSATASASSSTAASVPAPAPTSASALNSLGYQQMAAGNYAAAILTLRRAIAAAGPGGGLTYAYALYNLGDALLKSGNPQAAIPVLQQRLKIPDQTAVVQQTLNQALAAAGQSSGPASGGAPIPPGHATGPKPKPGHGHGGGGK
jgi:tetratricopeptide (TPR) repeat protein